MRANYATFMTKEIEAVEYAEINGNRAAGSKYTVDERIHEWQKNKKILSLISTKKGQRSGTTPLSKNPEESIMDWIIFRRSNVLRVSRKLVMKKALLTYQEITPIEGRAKSVEFKVSRGWLQKFMRHLKKILIRSLLNSCLI